VTRREELYPDITTAGGLGPAVRAAADRLGLDIGGPESGDRGRGSTAGPTTCASWSSSRSRPRRLLVETRSAREAAAVAEASLLEEVGLRG
jgi:hypothetical protein